MDPSQEGLQGDQVVEREDVSGFGWNEDTQMVDATDDVWEELRKVNIIF